MGKVSDTRVGVGGVWRGVEGFLAPFPVWGLWLCGLLLSLAPGLLGVVGGWFAGCRVPVLGARGLRIRAALTCRGAWF